MKENIQDKVLNTYNNNMLYLQDNKPDLFKKIKLLEEAFSHGLKKERYFLEYREEDYFDIYDKDNDSWLYDTHSDDYSQKIVNSFSFKSKDNSFKTFYDLAYEDGLVEKLDDISILQHAALNNAPIIDYVNKNLPEEEIMNNIPYLLILGVGLGFHIPKLHNLVKAKLYTIIEPSLEIFRLSLFLTDYSSLSKKARLEFFIAYSEQDFYEEFRNFILKTYIFSHYIKFFYFSKTCEVFFEIIQNILASQSHNLYSYDRELKSLNRTYNYLKSGYNFLNVTGYKNLSSFQNKKILLLAAGPSLKKNIDFVKENKSKFIIVAIWPILPLLTKNNIIPDIVTTYDEENKKVIDIYNEIEDKSFFEETIFLFSSHLFRDFVKKLPKENIYMFNALYSAKKDFGRIVAPAIGEITYQLLLKLGAKDIYLLGLDMALNPDTGKSHYDGYYEDKEQMKGEEKNLNEFSFRKNQILVKGNFRERVESLSVYHVSIKQFNVFTRWAKEKDKDIAIYNLSDGAFLNDTIPLPAANFLEKNLENINKKIFFDKLNDELSQISSSSFTNDDIEFNKNKIESAINLRNKLNEYMLLKYTNMNDFFKAIEKINMEVHLEKYKCDDLKAVIKNYFKHNLPYIVYLVSLKNIKNDKRHMKKVLKRLSVQVNKIIDFYLTVVE